MQRRPYQERSMFESAAIEKKLSKAEFEALEPRLRSELLSAQLDLAEAQDRAVVLVIAGVDGAGKALVVHRLLEWLDPRHIATHGFALPEGDELRFPPMWRYWRALPAKGRTAVIFGSWYHQPLYERISGSLSEPGFLARLHAIARFEQMLVREGVLLRKLWLHLPRHERVKRSKDKARDREIRMREWGDIGKIDYARAREAVEAMARITSVAEAPWTVVPGQEPRYRDALAGQSLLETYRDRPLATPCGPAPPSSPKLQAGAEAPTVLQALDLSQRLDKEDYRAQLRKQQERLHRLTGKRRFRKHGVVAVFEGPDAAGKGGCIRRAVRALDPRIYQVHSIAAPSDEELAHPYLWRFWRRIPPRGKLGIFDRSWYGRVLVERVEELAKPADWQRAYQEICDFESELVDSGLLVVKFWLQIGKAEQLRRFEARQSSPFKRFKITEEDWRNRAKWDAYQEAAVEMIDRTSVGAAPWTLVAAEDKRHARVTVLRVLADRLEAAYR